LDARMFNSWSLRLSTLFSIESKYALMLSISLETLSNSKNKFYKKSTKFVIL
jgi:hypothetical protein